MPHRLPLVSIEWVDSGQPIPGWQWLEGMECRRPHKCVSVGFLVQDDEETKVLAPNLGSSGGGGEWDQASGLITIPTIAVTRIARLTSSETSCRVAARGPTRQAS
jgi:hypothetical protein